ncbi:amino acid racemase [Candidatus Woesearchaeota archaeon]|nr:amino acid racemase [Candidatus Woesearchaeota archaeon]
MTKIGVLGGIGPEATGDFYSKVIALLQESGRIRDNRDYPQIIINSIPAPELIMRNIRTDDLLPYIAGLQELVSCTPKFIVMVCNTIHLFHDELQRHIEIELVDLREVVRKKLLQQKVKRICVFGTPATIALGLYNFGDMQYINLNDNEIEQLSYAVFNFNRGIDKQAQMNKVKVMAQSYIKKGAGSIILGCTEFAVMLKDTGLPVLNTIDVLAEYVVNRYLGKEL